MPDTEVSVLSSLTDVSAQDWDAVACPESVDGRAIDPFTTHRFLAALDRSGSTGKGTGWQPGGARWHEGLEWGSVHRTGCEAT
ncbi:MAG: N-acetyltransferase, partial [Rhodoferax sp.]|nr:N-acetyltransferase [Pseudorhodobacter sp.]